MAQPAAAGKASASAAPPAQPAISMSSISAQNESNPQTHPPVPVSSSNSQQKSQNLAARVAQSSPISTSTSVASTDAKMGGKPAEPASKSSADASSMDRALRTQEEARRLQFALAQQQVQQYQAMTKQLEAQSGIAMTPSSAIGNSNITSTTSVAGLAKTSEDLQKLRQEQLARLQQNVQRQATMAAQAVQKRSNEEWLRSKMLLEQEHLRLLRLHEQQLKQAGPIKGNTVTTATATSIADSLLAQQQQVIRQQQMLREMLQKQQKQQQAQLQLQMQLQKGGDTKPVTAQSVTTTTVTAPSKPYITATPTYYSVKKRKLKTAFDMELEALAKVCIRVANARTDCEMRQALDKMTSWLHRCTELMLLQIAQRDYRDCMAHRRPMLIQQNRWPLDLQVKAEFITQKIVQMLASFLLREKNKAAQQEAAAKAAAVASTAVATAAAATTTHGSASAGVSTASTAAPTSSYVAHAVATAASPATADASAPVATTSTLDAATTTTASSASVAAASISTAPDTATSATILAPAVRVPVQRDVATVEREYAELKSQLQARQLEVNQKAKAKRDAAKMEAAKAAGVVSNSATTAAMLAATYKRPLQVEIPGAVKKPRTDSPSTVVTAGYRSSTTSVPPISPRVAQQFYDLDLTTRTCTEPEDKMYLPPKIVSKIMYRALPGDQEEETAGTLMKREEQSKSRVPSPAVSPSHSVQEHEPCPDAISISDDAVTLMQECVTEFLLYFTSEARDLSIVQNRRTKKGVGLSISGSNVVESMDNLGFTSYARVLSGYNDKVKASQDAAARKKMERKKLVQQQAVQKAVRAAKAAAGKNVVHGPSLLLGGGANGARPMTVNAASTVTRVTPTANPATTSAEKSATSTAARKRV